MRQQAQSAQANEAHERQKAQTEAAKSQEVAQFLKDMLRGVSPSVARGRDTTVLLEMLDRTAERIGNDLTNQPEVRADLRAVTGELYDLLGESEKAEASLRDALATRRRVFGNESPAVADSLVKLGYTLWRRNLFDDAETTCRRSIQR